MKDNAMSDNRCVCCGEQIPEGSMVCPNCENKYNHDPEYEKLAEKRERRAEKFQRIMDDWVIPLALAGVVIFWIVRIIQGMS